MKIVILSTSLILETGKFSCREITLTEAQTLARTAENFVTHSTVRILGVEPTESRKPCAKYDAAIVLKVNGRIEFGKEYSIEEIEEIGYSIWLITKE